MKQLMQQEFGSKSEDQEKAKIYIEFDGKNFCCSKCFRIYERKKHAEDLKT